MELCGATVVSNVRSANMVIGSPTAARVARGHFAVITYVSEKWVLDSIQHHKVQSLQGYTLKLAGDCVLVPSGTASFKE